MWKRLTEKSRIRAHQQKEGHHIQLFHGRGKQRLQLQQNLKPVKRLREHTTGIPVQGLSVVPELLLQSREVEDQALIQGSPLPDLHLRFEPGPLPGAPAQHLHPAEAGHLHTEEAHQEVHHPQHQAGHLHTEEVHQEVHHPQGQVLPEVREAVEDGKRRIS